MIYEEQIQRAIKLANTHPIKEANALDIEALEHLNTQFPRYFAMDEILQMRNFFANCPAGLVAYIEYIVNNDKYPFV